jgi:ADP-ribose pyrophosphatase YjhB (NUDIX family)
LSERWLAWAQRLRAVGQTGLAYSKDPYDRERFTETGEIAEAMLANLVDEPPAAINGVYLPERGYPTPKVDVRAGVIIDDTVLLVRETMDGRWSLPGGWADERESPQQAIEREVFEESGFRVRAIKLAAIKDRSLHGYEPRRLEHVYKLLFLCVLQGDEPRGELANNIETTAAQFFPIDELPTLSTGRTLEGDVQLLRDHRDDQGMPTYFE